MKKMKNAPDMLEEYDFTDGIRGKYARRYAEGTNPNGSRHDIAGVSGDIIKRIGQMDEVILDVRLVAFL